MIITRQLPNGDFEVESFGDGIKAQARTLDEAREELGATIAVRNFARHRLRAIKRATHIAYDPQERCYVADCPAVGIIAQGWTRQAAWDKLLYGLRLADQARATAEAEAAEEAALATPSPELDSEPILEDSNG